MASNALPKMLSQRKDRAISIILTVKDRECDQYLPKEASSKLRKAVLDQINDLADFALDVYNSLDDGQYVLNEEYLRVLNEIHNAVVGED